MLHGRNYYCLVADNGFSQDHLLDRHAARWPPDLCAKRQHFILIVHDRSAIDRS